MRHAKKILLIDDEEDFCFFLSGNLMKTGKFMVIYATNPNRAVGMAKRTRPDIILLDISMPGISGFDVLKALKKNERTMAIPVIMLTAIDNEDAKIKALRLYNDDYVVKPVDYADLEARIDTVLRSRGS